MSATRTSNYTLHIVRRILFNSNSIFVVMLNSRIDAECFWNDHLIKLNYYSTERFSCCSMLPLYRFVWVITQKISLNFSRNVSFFVIQSNFQKNFSASSYCSYTVLNYSLPDDKRTPQVRQFFVNKIIFRQIFQTPIERKNVVELTKCTSTGGKMKIYLSKLDISLSNKMFVWFNKLNRHFVERIDHNKLPRINILHP